MPQKKIPLMGKLYDVEHALNIYAYSYAAFPAHSLYDDTALEPLRSVLKECHIYLVGQVPTVDVVNIQKKDDALLISVHLADEVYDLCFDVPEGCSLQEEDDVFFLEDQNGRRFGPSSEHIFQKLHFEHRPIPFKIMYIGQAYGRDGSRSIVERLRSHKTLQKIALTSHAEGFKYEIVGLELQPGNRTVTVMNPHASNLSNTGDRIASGLEKLFGTDEKERITIYEAALIRYFQPKFNIEFKNSFPSTRMKVLSDCYEKDFSSVIAEICIEEMPYHLTTDKIPGKQTHTAIFDLHKDEDRHVFFSSGT